MIPIRTLQHFLYCPHRWGMLYLEDAWQDNAFTVNAQIVHRRVDGGGLLNSVAGNKTYGDVTVFNDELGIYGKVDCLELRTEKGRACADIIEYKPTMPKTAPSAADRLQVYAQYVCVKSMFDGDVRAFVYYADKRRRVRLSFDKQDDELLRSITRQVIELSEKGIVPKPEKSDKCNGCSLYDRCMPRLKNIDVKRAIMEDMQ